MKAMRCILLFFSLFFIESCIRAFPERINDNFTPENLKKFVEKPEPNPIKIPQTKEKEGDLYQQFGVPRSTTRDEAFLGLIKKIEKKEISFLSFNDIPFIEDIPLPKKVKSFFGKLEMSFPRVSINARGGFSISGIVRIGDKATKSRIAVDKDKEGEKLYSITVELLQEWRFSDNFPKTEGFDPKVFDLIKFRKAWLVLSTANYYDPFLKRKIRDGLNLFGRAATSGPLFGKLNKLSRGALDKLFVDVHGVIGLNPKFIGTLLQVDLPVGIKFTKWLETTELSLLIGIEEQITKIPQVSIGITGGLKLFIPPRKNPILLTLTGKYSFPEDIELYGEMKGWLNNTPVPHMSIGDLRIGIITDLGFIIETEGFFGWVAGLNLAGGVGVMGSRLNLAVKGALDSKTAVSDLTFILKGDLRLKDMVSFWLQYEQDFEQLIKKETSFAKKVLRVVPDIKLENVRIIFVPRETIEEKKRIEIAVGKLKLFGVEGSGSFYHSRGKISGRLYLPEIVIGPRDNPLLYITGVGIGEHKGLVINTTLSAVQQEVFTDIEWGSSLFGGIKSRGRIEISPFGIELARSFKFGNLLDAELTIRSKLFRSAPGLENFFASIRLQQKGQAKLDQLLTKAASELLEDVQNKLDIIKEKQFTGLEEKLIRREASIVAEIAQLEQKIQNKKQKCNKQFTGLKVGIRPLCYTWRGVPIDSVKLLRKRFQRDVELDVRMIGDVVSIEIVTGAAKLVTRPVGKLIKFLSKLLNNTIQIKTFEARASLKKLRDGKPFVIKAFEANMFGKKISIKDVEFDLANIKLFLINLFDRLGLRFKDE